jgi:hypothetical protein
VVVRCESSPVTCDHSRYEWSAGITQFIFCELLRVNLGEMWGYVRQRDRRPLAPLSQDFPIGSMS